MKRKVWIDGLLFIAIGITSLIESFRLILYKDPHTLFDLLGPGYYLLIVSLSLMVTGIFYIFVNRRKLPGIKKETVSKGMRFRLIGSFAVLALYAIFLSSIGYFVSSLVFFVLEFRILGIKIWPNNIILSIGITAVYYFVFVKYCDMVFPRGLLF